MCRHVKCTRTYLVFIHLQSHEWQVSEYTLNHFAYTHLISIKTNQNDLRSVRKRREKKTDLSDGVADTSTFNGIKRENQIIVGIDRNAFHLRTNT